MKEDNHKVDSDDEDSWALYADASYGKSEIETEEIDTNLEKEEEVWYDGDDFEFEGATINWDAPPCPAPLGIEHIIRIGCCNFCVQRLAGRRTAPQGEDGGKEIRKEAYQRNSELEKLAKNDLCPMCENLFDDVENIVKRILEKIGEVEHSTIQLGIHLPKDLIEEEDRIRSRHGSPGSAPLKPSFVNEIQRRLSVLVTGVTFVKERPDLMILVDGLTLTVGVDVRPVFLYGRYRKLIRNLPQTRWPCRACRGRAEGCKSCNQTGLQYAESVQDLIGEPIRISLAAEDTSFHGMGREDIDVRCLGMGRPFVIEIKKPGIRLANLEEIQKVVNENAEGKVEINSLRWSNRSEVVKVKESRSEKSYIIRFKVEDIPDEETVIAALSSLSGVVLAQETPKRVAHRRAAKNRKRKVVSLSNIIVEDDEIQFSVRCEAGTYVKELIHSDEGRTVPSVRSVLGDKECTVLWLDVEDIHYE
jgi:tRNA pseudouridine synthase 10